MEEKESHGTVYILEVRDINLPVCKIGQTSKSAKVRCDEINRSSTGDFLWQVAHEFSVNDRKQFERIAHQKLEPLRQKNREFFNITAAVAFEAMRSILDAHPDIQIIDSVRSDEESAECLVPAKPTKLNSIRFRQRDSEYAETLALFAEVVGCKGRSFGQTSKPYFGMSDGVEGVQWNIKIFPDTGEARLGVNLEGMVYNGWPITNFIIAETENPRILEVRDQVSQADQVFVTLRRDAWQGPSRPNILEEHIAGSDIAIQDIHLNLWKSMLAEALACLSKERDYRGRAKQQVTRINKSNRTVTKQEMEVTPHLVVWTPVSSTGEVRSHIRAGIDRLRPIHDWVSKASQGRSKA